jgi:hypothetical protein
MTSDKQLIAHTPENAKRLRGAFAQSPYFMQGKWREATDEEVFAYAEGLIRGIKEAAPKFKAATDAMARAWADASKGLVKLSRALAT